MDGSIPSKKLTSESDSENPEASAETRDNRGAEEFDRSAPLSSSQILHRLVAEETGQDYYVYVPAEGATDAPVLVLVHDIDRDARSQAEAFAALSEREGVVLVAPHFAADRYPNYQRLGRSRNAADERISANEALDHILENVAAVSGANVDRFHLFGFGSGGRFAMRYAMLNPERVSGAAIAEPGAYTFPDENRRFPRGIAPSRKRPDFQPDPDRFLRVPITLFEFPSDPDDPSRARLEDLDRDAEGDDGVNGRSWVEAMVEASLTRRVVPGVSLEVLARPMDSFAEFRAEPELADRVLEILLSGDPALRGSVAQPLPGEALPEQGGFFRSNRFKRIALAGLIACVLIGLITPLFLWTQYRSAHVISRDAVLRGHIAEVGAQLNGVVKSIEVDAGDRVAAGQVVARLEDRQFEAKRMQAASNLEKARRELEVERLAIENERAQQKSSLRGVSADLSAADAELRASQSRAEEARRRFELQRSLAAKGLVSEERVREAQTEYRTARALVSAARAGRTSAVAGQEFAETVYDGLSVREKRISVLESAISGLEAELSLAEANLESTVIRAPEEGAVVRRIVEPGGSTVAGQPIISLWLGREIWVEAWIDEDEFGQVAVGNRATVTFLSHPDREFGGVIESLAVATDIELPDSEVPQPRKDRMRDAPVVSARVKLDDHKEVLFPGLSAVVAIRKQER